ncbi:hypothetical protein U1Q18_028613 [Sarracenia purpurea var. burkii]
MTTLNGTSEYVQTSDGLLCIWDTDFFTKCHFGNIYGPNDEGKRLMGNGRLKKVKSVWGNDDFEWATSAYVRTSGGLLCIWDKDFFTVEDKVLISGTLNSSWECLFGNIYGPNDEGEG